MIPVDFPEANVLFGPPEGLDESQCMTITAFSGKVAGGSVDGANITVTAWKPSAEELEALKNGSPIFISFIGGLPPHFLTTVFQSAIKPG